MNIKQNYKKIIGTSLLINVIVICLSVMLVLSQTTNTFTISSGIYPQASYTIWREGLNYYVKNAYGVIVYSGINATVVLNNAFANGGRQLIKSGIYEGNFIGGSEIILEGEGIYETILRASSGIILDFYDVVGYFSIKNLQLDGVSRNTSGGIGLRLGMSGGGNQMPAGYFQNLRIQDVETGISFSGAHSDSLFEIVSISTTKTGIMYQGLHNTFNQLTIHASAIVGVYFVNMSEIVFHGGIMTTNQVDFIVNNTEVVTIHENEVWHENSANGIFDNSSLGYLRWNVQGSHLHTYNAILFSLESVKAPVYVVIDGAELAGSNWNITVPSVGFYKYYVNTINGFILQRSQNKGTSTGTGGEQTIPHGLIITPNNVNIIPTVTGATVSSVWADATNIYCTVTNAKAYEWSASIIYY